MSPQTLHYRLLNVFTCPGDALSGNPLCVFERGEGLTAATMQRLARQFNLSETTFVLPPSTPHARARVRIFTPSFEMPFAGHPTLGTAAVVRSLGLGGDRLVLELAAGLVTVEAHGERWTLTAALSGTREPGVSRDELARRLGLAESDLGERPLWVSTGREQLIVPLTSVDAVRRAAPGPGAFEALRSVEGASMAYVFAFADGERGRGTSVGATRREAVARFFFPQGASVLEDPATGSAAANLGGWWCALGRALPLALTIHQGEQTGRPSRLYLDVPAGADGAGGIHVGGEVVEIGRGSITLG